MVNQWRKDLSYTSERKENHYFDFILHIKTRDFNDRLRDIKFTITRRQDWREIFSQMFKILTGNTYNIKQKYIDIFFSN